MWRQAGSNDQLRRPTRLPMGQGHVTTPPRLLRHAVVLALLLTSAQLCWAASYCRNGDPIYDGVQARTLSAQFVFVGKVLAFYEYRPVAATPTSTKSSLTAQNAGRLLAANVLVKSVAKQTSGRNATPSDRVTVFGVVAPGTATSSVAIPAGSSDGLGAAALPLAGCVTSATPNVDYIFFVNSTADDGVVHKDPWYVVVHAAAKNKWSDFRLARGVACPGVRHSADGRGQERCADSRGCGEPHAGLPLLLAAIDWYWNGTRLLLPTAAVARSSRLRVFETRRVGSVTSTLQWTRVRPIHAGEYVCAARNALGSSSAACKLEVLPRQLRPSSTAPATGAETVRRVAATVSKRAAEQWTSPKVVVDGSSNYVDCPPSHKGYCLDGGRCQMHPNGFGVHCACAKDYLGVRCEQKGCAGCPVA